MAGSLGFLGPGCLVGDAPHQAQGGEGIDEAVQGLVALADLLPLLAGAAEAVAGDQLLGGQLVEILLVEGAVVGEMDIPGPRGGLAQAGVYRDLAAVDPDRLNLDSLAAAQALGTLAWSSTRGRPMPGWPLIA